MSNTSTVYFKSIPMTRTAVLCAFILFCSLSVPAFSQSQAKKTYRSLAPGVMKTIKPDFKFEETYTDKEIVELTSLGQEFDWAKTRFPNEKNADDIPFTCLEFQFKVPRLIEVNLPTKEGKIVKTPIWYVIYNVTNKKWATEEATKLGPLQANLLTESDLKKLNLELDFGSTVYVEEISAPIEQVNEGRRFQVKAGESSIVFTPQFVLASESLPFPKTEQYVVVEQMIPLALPAIIKQEDPNRQFETSVSMADRKIEPGETVWGIAMWKDVDADIKDFSIYVSGLSNAYLWDVDKQEYRSDEIGSGYQMSRKTLKLNFWAPGAADHLLNKEIQYGTRSAVAPEKTPVDFEWVYR